jgi:hypothetical protein
MTISRRPKRRASSDKPPGPSNAIAAAMTIISKDTSLPSNRFPVGGGSHEIALPAMAIPIKTLTAGVRNPITRHAPLMTSSRQENKDPQFQVPPWDK